MFARDWRRHRQQESVEGELKPLPEVELLALSELLDEALEARAWGCSGSGEGRCEASVCSCSRREASCEADMNEGGSGRRASSGWVGSEGVQAWYSETGLVEGVSREKCEAGTMLK